MRACLAFCSLFLATPFTVAAQEYIGGKDFLTDHEIDLVREAQEPDKRIAAYLEFARLRIELIRQRLAVEKPGRSVDIHRNLEEFSKIIEAVDMVVDDALVRDVDLTKGIELLTQQESTFLATLQEMDENPADDHWRYEFVLDDAIEITTDSLELAKEDPAERKRKVVETDADSHKQIEGSAAPQVRQEMEKAKAATKAKEDEQKRKQPTLMKPSEKKEKQR